MLDTKPHVVPGAKTEGSGTGTVEFRDVSFRYPGAAADELEHISFKVEKGQTLAIIGATGSGKTTLASPHSALLRRDGWHCPCRRAGRARVYVRRALQQARLCDAEGRSVLRHG
ncbi:MAG: ATP-binding cassette domain-containing protein [Oscillospiraceae bacterium]